MKRTYSLHTLFATLVAACGPTISPGDDEGASTQDETSATEGTSATTDASVGTSTTTSASSYDTYDGGCWEDFLEEEFELRRSALEPWLEAGEIPFDLCEEACHATGVPGWWDAVIGCTVGGDVGTTDGTGGTDGDDGTPPPETTGDMGTSGEAESGGTTGDGEDPLVWLRCEGVVVSCGEGRGHAALQPAALPSGCDSVGRWAATAAHAEAASVGSFLALRDELSAYDAPAELVARALDAARDEVVHARMMTRIATRLGATPRRPRFGAIEIRDLEAFAIENAVEGCVRETWSALQATHQAAAASDPEIRAVMRRIAEDETRHAELAHDIDAWLRTRLGAAAVARLDQARQDAVAELMQALERCDDPDLRDRAGFASPERAHQLAAALRATLWS